MNIPRGWLDIEHKDIEYYAVPLISWNDIFDWNNIYKSYKDINGIELIAVQAKVSSKAFAVKIGNDMMESLQGISFPRQAIIIADPEKQAKNYSFVVAYDETNNAATFRQQVLDGNQIYLKPLNPQYPVIKLRLAVQLILN